MADNPPKLFTRYVKLPDNTVVKIQTSNPKVGFTTKKQAEKVPHSAAFDSSAKPPTPETPTSAKPRPVTSTGAKPPSRAPGAAATARPLPRVSVAEAERGEGVEYRTAGIKSTWFKAMGTMADLEDMRSASDSPPMLLEVDDELPIRRAFYSKENQVLGQVKRKGIVPLGRWIRDLNVALQFVNEEMEGFDFRLAYDEWEYTYQVIETIGGIDIERIRIVRGQGGSPRKRKLDGVFVDGRKVGK